MRWILEWTTPLMQDQPHVVLTCSPVHYHYAAAAPSEQYKYWECMTSAQYLIMTVHFIIYYRSSTLDNGQQPLSSIVQVTL